MNAILHQHVTNYFVSQFLFVSLFDSYEVINMLKLYKNFDIITLIRLIKHLHKIIWLIPVLETEAKDVEKHT